MVGAFEQEGEYNFTSQITISQTQIDWLIRDLKTVNRLVTPWVVAMIHTVSLLYPPGAQPFCFDPSEHSLQTMLLRGVSHTVL